MPNISDYKNYIEFYGETLFNEYNLMEFLKAKIDMNELHSYDKKDLDNLINNKRAIIDSLVKSNVRDSIVIDEENVKKDGATEVPCIVDDNGKSVDLGAFNIKINIPVVYFDRTIFKCKPSEVPNIAIKGYINNNYVTMIVSFAKSFDGDRLTKEYSSKISTLGKFIECINKDISNFNKTILSEEVNKAYDSHLATLKESNGIDRLLKDL